MVPDNAVIVWQLRGYIEEVDCYFMKQPSGFTLSVERAGERLAEERFESLHETMRRAKEMRKDLLDVGFTPVLTIEPEPVLESLLMHFVREGTTLVHASPGA
jgi:hypothetical protein